MLTTPASSSTTTTARVDSAACRRDPCVVETDGLAIVIERFVVAYERTYFGTAPRTTTHNLRNASGSFAGRDPEVETSAFDALSRRTSDLDRFETVYRDTSIRERPEHGPGIAKEQIRKIAQRRYRTTELRTADLLVTAAAQPTAWFDGTLVVHPNPRAPEGVRGLCCGGSSLTGSLSF